MAQKREQAASDSPTPYGSVTVRRGSKALVASTDRCLLVKERHADGTPFWTLPGGGIHTQESPKEALRRELAEELRCQCHVTDSTAQFWYVHSSLDRTVSIYTVFECALLSAATPAAEEGIHDARWVDPADPPARTLPQVRTLLGNSVPP